MTTIWITGGKGFIGRHLARLVSGNGDIVSGIGHGLWPAEEAGKWGYANWSNGEIDAAFATISQRRVDAVLVGTDGYLITRRDQFAALANRYRMPIMYPFPAFPAAGGLISYGPSLTDGYRKAGIYVGRILKGAKPADLPILQPTKFDLVINLKAAKAIGITISPMMLARANKVIE